MEVPMVFSSEFKNQVISRILSKEISITDAHREYGIGKSTVYKWIKKINVDVSNPSNLRRKESPEIIPLPRGMNLRAAIAAEGHCQILGLDSQKTGQFCRSHGITLEELKAFSAWINANDDIVPATQFRTREKELTQAVAKLSSDNLEKDKAIRRQEKALSEAAALLILSKKAQAIWGGQGRMICSQDRQKALELINKAIAQGVRTIKACEYLGIAFSTYLKWSKDPKDQDARPGAQRIRNHRALQMDKIHN